MQRQAVLVTVRIQRTPMANFLVTCDEKFHVVIITLSLSLSLSAARSPGPTHTVFILALVLVLVAVEILLKTHEWRAEHYASAQTHIVHHITESGEVNSTQQYTSKRLLLLRCGSSFLKLRLHSLIKGLYAESLYNKT